MAFIEVSGVSKSFVTRRHARPALSSSTGDANGGVRRILHEVSLSVAQGEFVSIVGAMGSGKSTLLSILAGLTAADSGTVTVGGDVVRGVRPDAAFVFQNYSLLPWFTALENVRLAVDAAFPDLERDAQVARARRALEQVGLGTALNRRPGQLSGGMRQRVAIARSLVVDPKVLLMDEPFGALDALTRETVQQDLVRLCSATEKPVTTVMITNSVEEALLLSDWVVPMLPGPPATLGAPIPVQLSRPRSLAQLAHEEDATHVRAHVIAALTDAIRGRTRRTALKPGANAATPIALATRARAREHLVNRQPHVVVDREPRQERVVLEHDGAVRARIVDLLVLQEHRAAGHRDEPGHDIEHRGLAAARMSDDRDIFALFDAERNVAQHLGFLRAAGESLVDVIDPEISRHRLSLQLAAVPRVTMVAMPATIRSSTKPTSPT